MPFKDKDRKKEKKAAKPEREQKSVMSIDLSRLEEEWQGQAELYEKPARELAEARRALADLKIDLIVAEAEAGQDVRANPEDYGLEKVTEAGVKEAKDSHKEVIRTKRAIVEAAYLVDLLEGTCRALEHRKRALEKEVDLFMAGYFAAPKEQRKSLAPRGGGKVKGVRDPDEDEDEDD